MVQPMPTPSLLAVATGIIGAAWSSGMIASLSLCGISTALDLNESSSTLTSSNVWAGLYDHGIAIMPKVAVGLAASYLYSAYDAHNRSKNWKGYVAAAGLAVMIAPWTFLTMLPTNDMLRAVATRSVSLKADEVARLLRKWEWLNLGRSLFSLASAVVGFGTLYQNMS